MLEKYKIDKSMQEEKTKSLAQLEEEILEFWEQNKIFEKSILQRKDAKRYVFYDGPPFATGLPHYGHILASTIKDMVPRYWTMRGFQVDRRWGWDCHGLPVENLVEQELNISGRRAIQKLGIKKFNETARSKVLEYAAEWFKTIRRIGRFVDFENYYATMQPAYMESVLWAFSALFKKGLVFKDSRTALFCPRCETQLSNFEIAMDNSYRDQEDDSVYVKLKLEGTKNEYLLVWTTTPWTLPGNAAVAVNPKIEYTKYKIERQETRDKGQGKDDYEYIWAATTPPHEPGDKIEVVEKTSGKHLIGKKYIPLFPLTKDKNAYNVVGADFVDITEGTGLVHIAPAFGEEDFLLGKKEKLPLLSTLDDLGQFNDAYPELKMLAGKKTNVVNKILIDWLKEKKFLWSLKRIIHRYPICWRCQTPLIYKVEPAWFIKVSSLKASMLKLNEKIDWHPKHLKYGRFGNDLESAPDWNVSRSRFWGTPIPIWECTQCKKIQVLGSREEFHKHSLPVKNRYLGIRHGESTSNTKNIVARDGNHHLTLKGKLQTQKSARKLRKEKIDMIFSSTILRAKETAEIVGKELGIFKINFDERLNETNFGIFEGRSENEYNQLSLKEMFVKAVPGGESLSDIRVRTLALVEELEQKLSGKKILFVTHHDPLWMLSAGAWGTSNEEALRLQGSKAGSIVNGGVVPVNYRYVPRNDNGELDFHLPYVDQIKIYCEHCKGEAKRIPDVFDCWFESGSMPFAEKHYPFENKSEFEKNFPADFIAEYIAQTRGWFNKLHVLATALFRRPAFKHAVTTGTIMAESGEKLSKSKKNFPDPWLLFGKYGVDAIRYYLMASPVMQADNINFSEKDVDEIYKKYSLISYNVLNFFKLYQNRLRGGQKRGKRSTNVLDRWILSRLHSTIQAVTKGFNGYEIPEATRPLLGFVQDLSLWYVRRSRDRIKSDTEDASSALTTLQNVLFDFARLSAPVTPFLSEILYRDLANKRKLSVHLEDWPKLEKKYIDKNLEALMEEARTLVSQALRLRAEARIKVRQPLAELQVTSKKLQGKSDLLQLIKDEVNIKHISFGKELKLDTLITPELKEEGIVREFIRNVQEMRRDLGLKPSDIIYIQIFGMDVIQQIVGKWEPEIKKDTTAKHIKIGGKKIFALERDLLIEGFELWAGISKLNK